MPVRTEAQLEAAQRRIHRSEASFVQSIRDWENSVGPSLLAPVHRKIHLQALTKVVLRTPVDTGRARGNWQSTTGGPAASVLGVKDRGGNNSMKQGRGVTEEIDDFGVSYITNNLDYILGLEAGTSTQAPQGMVAQTISEIEETFS